MINNQNNVYTKDDLISLLEFITNENSPYAIMYGDQLERFATNDSNFTIEEVIQHWIESKNN